MSAWSYLGILILAGVVLTLALTRWNHKMTEIPVKLDAPFDYNIAIYDGIVDGVPIKPFHLTDLYVPSGKIVAADPFVMPDMPPLDQTIPPGRYPVTLYIARLSETHERIALAVLMVKEERASRFELALREGDDISRLTGEDDYLGFPVDAGLGSLFDYETGVLYVQLEKELLQNNPTSNIYDAYFAERFQANASELHPYGSWLDFQLPNAPQYNVAMFQSGWGDGVYPVYWGRNEAGEIVNLVIDFQVVPDPQD